MQPIKLGRHCQPTDRANARPMTGSTPSRRMKAAGLEMHLALARRFQAPEQQGQQGVDPRGELWIAPFLGMRGMVEAAGGVEKRSRRSLDVDDLKHAVFDAIG